MVNTLNALHLMYLLDRVLFARKAGEDGAVASTSLGGEVISMEDASVSKQKTQHNKTINVAGLEDSVLGQPKHYTPARVDKDWSSV